MEKEAEVEGGLPQKTSKTYMERGWKKMQTKTKVKIGGRYTTRTKGSSNRYETKKKNDTKRREYKQVENACWL